MMHGAHPRALIKVTDGKVAVFDHSLSQAGAHSGTDLGGIQCELTGQRTQMFIVKAVIKRESLQQSFPYAETLRTGQALHRHTEDQTLRGKITRRKHKIPFGKQHDRHIPFVKEPAEGIRENAAGIDHLIDTADDKQSAVQRGIPHRQAQIREHFGNFKPLQIQPQKRTLHLRAQ